MPPSRQAKTFTIEDLYFLYNQIDPDKASDIPRILRGLGGASTFTVGDLQSRGDLGGLSSRSLDAWRRLLEQLASADDYTPPPPAGAGDDTGGDKPPPPDRFKEFLPPIGDIEKWLTDLFRKGPGGFTAPAGETEEMLRKLFGGGIAGFTPAPGAIEKMIAGLTPGSLTPPASAGETGLLQLMSSPFLTSVAAGQVPPAIKAQFEQQLAQQLAGVRESFGTAGARFGTDITRTLGETAGKATTDLMANTERDAMTAIGLQSQMAQGAGTLANQRATAALSAYQQLVSAGVSAEVARSIAGLNAFTDVGRSLLGAETTRTEGGLARFFGTGAGLLAGEQGRSSEAMDKLFREFLLRAGLPPEIAGLLGVNFGPGTSTQTTRGGGGSGFQDAAGTAATIASLVAMSGGCWVALRLYGPTWRMIKAAMVLSFRLPLFWSVYRRHGRLWARDPRMVQRLKPLFDWAST